MENNQDFEKDQEEFTQQELEQEVLWMRALLELEEKEIPLPESLRSEHLLEKIRDAAAEEPEAEKTPVPDTAPQAKNKGKVLFFKLASCAACLALVVFGWRQISMEGSMITQSAAGAAPAASSASAAPAAAETAEMAADTAADAAPLESLQMAEAEAPAVPKAAVELPEQPSAADYGEVYGAVSEIYEKRHAPRKSVDYRSSVTEMAVEEDAVMFAAPKANPATAGGEAYDAGVSSTNVQIDGIDEADIVKTDGVYLYHYRFDQQTGGAEVAIIAANGLKLLSTIQLPDYTDAELYVSGDRLILVQTASEDRVRGLLGAIKRQPLDSGTADSSDIIIPDYIEPSEEEEVELIDMVETVVYDLSDRKNPRETASFQQDGVYVSSRLSGNTLYLVTNKDLYRFTPDGGVSPLARYLPIMGENGKASALEAGDILLPPYRENLNYAVVSALNLESEKREAKAVLGMAEQIMMSADALFLTASLPAEGENAFWWDRTDTGVTRFAVTGGTLGYLSSGRVPGLVDSQFALDEYNGNLRIATTSRNAEGESVNNLFVYNQKMEKIGGVEDLAPGERIYSARFLGNTAYLVTYRQTDPLFVIDLSNPKKPVVKGELKIPGFSEYLHPIDEDTLLGFGRNTVVTQWGDSSEDGLKLSLFDVSNPSDPKEISSYLLGNAGSSSDVLDNHKAFLYDPQRKLAGFPATIRTASGARVGEPWSGDRTVTFSGYLLVKVNEDGFELYGTLPSEGGNPAEGFQRSDPANAIERGVYIGNTFYTIASGRIRAYSLDGLEPLGELVYHSSQP